MDTFSVSKYPRLSKYASAVSMIRMSISSYVWPTTANSTKYVKLIKIFIFIFILFSS